MDGAARRQLCVLRVRGTDGYGVFGNIHRIHMVRSADARSGECSVQGAVQRAAGGGEEGSQAGEHQEKARDTSSDMPLELRHLGGAEIR